MKVYILAYGSTPWQNGQLIYHEAKRQNKDVELGFIEWPFTHIIREIKRSQPDWIFLTGSRAYPPEKLKELANLAKLAIWDADAVDEKRNKIWKDLKGIPSVIFTVITDLDKTLADRVLWLPQYYDDISHKSTNINLPQIYDPPDVIFFGTLSKKRVHWKNELLKKFKIQFYNSVQGPPMDALYKLAKISFGIWRDEFTAGDFATSDRIYKAMGAGCFYLTHPIKKIDLLFKPGEHLDTYDGTLDDLIFKIDYYLNRTELREKIASDGCDIIYSDHLLSTRLNRYWDILSQVCK